MPRTHKRPMLLIYDVTLAFQSRRVLLFSCHYLRMCWSFSLGPQFRPATECCNYNKAKSAGRDKAPDIRSLSNGRWPASGAASTARRHPSATSQRQCFHTEENCSCCRSSLGDVAAIDPRDVHRPIRPIGADWADCRPGRPNSPCPVTDYRKDFCVDDAASSWRRWPLPARNWRPPEHQRWWPCKFGFLWSADSFLSMENKCIIIHELKSKTYCINF